MGKNLPTQRRGRGTSPTYRSPSHRHLGPVNLPGGTGEGTVVEIRHAPGRSAPVARVDVDGREFLMIAPDGLHVGQPIAIGVPRIDRGSILPLGQLPEGTLVYNVEGTPGDGGRFVRAAGTAAVIVSQGARTVIRLPSGQFKELNPRCRGIVGVVAGAGRGEKPFYKAGKHVNAYRSLAKSAITVRGVAKNPVDHPHGGGAHQHVGRPSTVSSHAPPGRKVGRLSPKRKRRGK
ncbi:MAG TPA: 50S ribosomal protein L2 [Thermoplasmata archaeon]|uniref:50S ribosomal protein L2 n=1 Tax=uncultured euryarchaeote Rifle_16ft_4_minimus_37789 TaxID=1665195 RepID=A0A0H4T5A3_9EURY|nr:ribosomal protein L2, large subunit ribosomal protein L2 [uncultured euryarchaeote Rifle_16ft_4_minimus_37789]HKZ63690.1 50S ribosomal protein L2 [Thermoplasmata archaeon]